MPLHMRKLQINQKAMWLAISLSTLASVTHADDAVKTTFSGFGTIVGTTSSNKDFEFKNAVFQTKGVKKSDGLDFGLDSRVGLQGRAEFDPTISITGQVIAQRNISKDLDPQIEWLYGQWSGLPGLDIRLGRVVLPSFMISDSRFVTYAMPGVRAPVLVYSMFPYSFIDGAQATYRQRLADVNWTLSVGAGKNTVANAKHVKNLTLTAEVGDWTARYGYVGAQASLDVGALGVIYWKDTFHNLGLQYDNGDYFGSAEYVLRKDDPKYFDATAWYVTAGARFGKWTPWATISRQSFKAGGQGIPVPGAPSFVPPVVLASPAKNTKGIAGGVRYDVATNVAFKAEYGRYEGASGILVSPSTTVKQKFNLLSIGLDFIF